MASAEEGYHVADYVLFETQDALVMRPGEGEIYAVTLRTPFERARVDELHAGAAGEGGHGGGGRGGDRGGR